MEKTIKTFKKTQIFKRFKSESPELFRKITNICITAGVIGAGILAAPAALPAYIVALAPHLITAGALGGLISKATVKNTEDIQ